MIISVEQEFEVGSQGSLLCNKEIAIAIDMMPYGIGHKDVKSNVSRSGCLQSCKES
jgi:hypothetical protein